MSSRRSEEGSPWRMEAGVERTPAGSGRRDPWGRGNRVLDPADAFLKQAETQGAPKVKGSVSKRA